LSGVEGEISFFSRAFVAGMMIPHDSAYAVALTTKTEDFITVTLLPAYFAVSGLKTQVS
jgi:Kef-type K+ transport system membrane component KefB